VLVVVDGLDRNSTEEQTYTVKKVDLDYFEEE